MSYKILAADIGGTSSRFAHFTVQAKNGDSDATLRPELVGTTWLKSAAASSFGDLLSQLDQSDFSLKAKQADYCVFAIAGPVEQGLRSNPPNIPWTVDLGNAEAELGIAKFSLINDFLAQAYAALSPIGADAEQLVRGNAVPKAAIGVLGAGTGLGKAALVPNGYGGYVGVPSEGGHVNFSPQSPRECEFMSFMEKRIGSGYVVWDDVVSGRGVSAVHEFLTGEKLDPKEVGERFVDADNETLAWCARFYGRVCRNFALEVLALGGIYLAGGVAAKNPMLITHPEFVSSFRSSRSHASLLQQIPVSLMDNQESGLWGAGFLGAQELTKG